MMPGAAMEVWANSLAGMSVMVPGSRNPLYL
jgi:hypothetical protein